MFQLFRTKWFRSAPVVSAIWTTLTAGIIGWSGREYVRAVRGKKNAAEYEIIIDTDLAWQCLKRGAAWPLQANREGKNGELREKDNNVTLNGPRG